MSRLDRLARHPRPVTLVSAALDLSLLVAKLAIGILVGSLALVSDAVHSALDLTAGLLAFFAIRAAEQPADVDHPYGHGRAENLAAYTEGVLLLLAAGTIAYEAVRRLRRPVAVEAALAALVLLVSALLVEVARTVLLRRLARTGGSPALAALATDKASDLLSVSAVLAGLLGVRAGVPAADSVAALAVAGLIVYSAVRLLKQSADILMDRAVREAATAVSDAVSRVPGIKEVRSVKVRGAGTGLIGEVEVAGRRTLSLEAADDLVGRVERAVADRLPNLQLSVLVKASVDQNQLVERVHAAAARNGSFRDLHDVVVEQEADASLHLSLHAKLPSQLSMREAGGLVTTFESDLRAELPGISRIDVHLEPLEPDLVQGRDVTGANPGLVSRLGRLLGEHPKVAGGGDVELSSRRGQITAHVAVRVPDDLTLEQAHEVETELEELIRRTSPELHDVVVRVVA
ncbi:MAG TPA: cation diffusion facilitator family transporter [Candidatus Dormibacteraeota bacterium]|nr:cation diffusion facilitator family transporter [Candidatus Dormibacteraeota bacterium]